MSAVLLTAGARGFDCNSRLTPATATAFKAHDYTYAIRYVPRVTRHENDLTLDEVGCIRACGLGLMIVQHVESESAWTPTPAKGIVYGETAARWCVALGYAPAANAWLDLEGVAKGVPASDIIGYCNNWSDAVSGIGYEPGLYVGWAARLTAEQLYRRLKFRCYWAAYNLNSDEYPAVRGVQMKQHAAKPSDLPPGVHLPIDVDVVTGDALGGFPAMDLAD